MLLKKQTVWLLTMLSLVIVLSVYYITSPTQQVTDMAAEQNEGGKKAADNKETAANGDVEVVTDSAGNEVFEAMRMEVEDQRAQLREELEAKVGDPELSAEEKSAAYEQMENLRELAMTESVLETTIKTIGYDDALVRANGDSIRITVKTDKEHTKANANEIIRLVMSEVGNVKPVAVEFQPTN
ncbi:stage III sporulation protein AH [[Bacillus] enclensis]|jgi:stage III sporulation protein AH|uniref:Stage III sporulation protein AH n=2 Tax=Rossellomorea TaxID=2837508 RepID=A0A0V8HN80_9BACI|nr:SpoIIIAH-like family protein [[Bacillus] enclensis]OAT84162.1 stage III sporulation protein AH [Bacillus sp. MKU004]QTC43457.1 SpoIIIAH-like family protein [Bacillus sp. V3]QWC21627.1 SpoIIIAH-like family protein [Bacillus haikouensis]KSU63601.1 stage III sporulation protein AH [[Bacillus] enclensis]MBH9967397.1 SpoIIIAH-like family protein [[Bacillus] enclensis]